MMDIGANTLAVALALVASLLSPVVLLILQGREKRMEKTQQWERDDAVAAKAEKAAKDLLEATVMQTAKLEVIHKLVNSNLTEAKQAQYNALELHAESLLRELKADPTNDSIATMYASIQNKIKNLGAELTMRRAHDAAQMLAPIVATGATHPTVVAPPVTVVSATTADTKPEDMPTVNAPVRVIDSESSEVATADVIKKKP